ncbi:MAG: hypothetical protein EON93_04145 [Burkholderiales bacterium]|nr:MAG: hypothetical protein EON93_04145 [Burkholderiales bacterium]
MAYDKRFDQVRSLPRAIQDEIIREGEAHLDAQLQSANASDQRAMAWAGFLITIATAAVGGAFALLLTKQHDAIAGVAFGFAVSTIASAIFAMNAVRPSKFCFPGNSPENWLPENWTDPPVPESAMSQARAEQASALNNRIAENRKWADSTGRYLRLSMDFSIASVCFWAVMAVFVAMISEY